MSACASASPRAVALLATAILYGCAGGTPATSPPAPAAAERPAREGAAPAARVPARVRIEPSSLTLELGDTARVVVRTYDRNREEMEADVVLFPSDRRDLEVRPDGWIRALRPGQHALRAMVPVPDGPRDETRVTVLDPAVGSVTIAPVGERFFVGASVRHAARVVDASGMERPDIGVEWETSDPGVASVDRFGVVTAHRPGKVTITASARGVRGQQAYTVVPNPMRSLELIASPDSGRTGDVIRFTAIARDARGRRVSDVPIAYTVVPGVEDTVIAPSPPAAIDSKGRFVAERAGHYTVWAIAPGHTAHKTLPITHRGVGQRVELVGRGAVRDVHTSDLWVWEGVDGRDYALTGTWGANGVAYFWDVTDPTQPVKTDSVQVDARTVNDVKISEDGTVAVISREGASNRRNGIVILDVTNPRDVQILSRFDDELTGGVHNVFIHENHVYAVNNGRRYDIINIEDARNPRRVARFKLDVAGTGVHDVWVVDGIAYSSNWLDGVVLVDVGNGVAGGSPSNPVKFASYKYPIGATHSAFPYRSPTGKFYVFVGDEIFPSGFAPEEDGIPEEAGGYVHIVDFTDPKNPEEVARYEIPEAGPHNFWIEDDKLYVAYYNAGLRVVDISGELKGNLYNQEREIARFLPYDPQGFTANAPMAWGPQPHKGHIFISDFNSGLWVVRLVPPEGTLVP